MISPGNRSATARTLALLSRTLRSDQERPDSAASRLFQKLVEMKFLSPAEFGKLTGGQRPRRAAGKPARKGAARPKAAPARKAAKGRRR